MMSKCPISRKWLYTLCSSAVLPTPATPTIAITEYGFLHQSFVCSSNFFSCVSSSPLPINHLSVVLFSSFNFIAVLVLALLANVYSSFIAVNCITFMPFACRKNRRQVFQQLNLQTCDQDHKDKVFQQLNLQTCDQGHKDKMLNLKTNKRLLICRRWEIFSLTMVMTHNPHIYISCISFSTCNFF
jgi:hypothetical protein